MNTLHHAVTIKPHKWGRRGKPEGKRPLGRPRQRWVDNIKMDLREMGWCRLD
jgi:hypothetical protein